MNRRIATLLATIIISAGCAGPSTSVTPTHSTQSSPSPSAAGSSPTAAPSATALPAATPQPPPGPDAAAQALVDRMRQPAYTIDTTAATLEALARSGIGTYADPTATAPEIPVAGATSPLRLLDFQAHALAVDAWGGQGLSGAELDSLLPIPTEVQDQSAPASAFLAGYVAAIDSPGAALARALMAGQDLSNPQQLHFPLFVLTLFASDLATEGGQAPAAVAPGFIEAAAIGPSTQFGAGSGPNALATLCSDAANFIDHTIHDLFSALKLAVPDNAVGAFVVTIWNWIVDQGEAFVHTLIKTVTDIVLATVRAIAGGIAAIANEVAAPGGVEPHAVGRVGGQEPGCRTIEEPLHGRSVGCVAA